MTKEKERRSFGGFIETMVGASCRAMGYGLLAMGYGLWALAITYKLSLS